MSIESAMPRSLTIEKLVHPCFSFYFEGNQFISRIGVPAILLLDLGASSPALLEAVQDQELAQYISPRAKTVSELTVHMDGNGFGDADDTYPGVWVEIPDEPPRINRKRIFLEKNRPGSRVSEHVDDTLYAYDRKLGAVGFSASMLADLRTCAKFAIVKFAEEN